ncbi:MAG: glycine cleavage system aminomethyltransferase GcvT [Acidimicrobiia bacterium]|nr:glycine cleavage system aminomethyltransferase GcvT [Acidimicrobiia bacterium]
MTASLRSPLHATHEALGARFTDFGGWEMPLQYAGTLAEHHAVRSAAGVFDVSHLGRFAVDGPDAEALVGRMLCNHLGRIAPGRAQYTLMLTPSGGVIDDIIVWWLAPGRIIVLPNGVNHDRVRDAFAGAGADVHITDLRPTTVLLAVQGPQAPALLATILGTAPKRFRVSEVDGMVAAGTGYTGESGAELIVEAARATGVWERLTAGGATPCGLGARDTLRLEMGYPLWGQDLDVDTTPLEAGLEWVVDWDHEFVGRDALIAQRAAGPSRTLVGFAFPDRRIPRHGFPMRCGHSIGVVSSGNFSPSLEVGIGMGYLAPVPPADASVEVEVRGEWFPARRVDPPFLER